MRHAETYEFEAEGLLVGSAADSNHRKMLDAIVQQRLAVDPQRDLVNENDRALRVVSRILPTARKAAQAIAQIRSGPSYCYLAFYGSGDVANFVKVGISKHPEQRLYGIGTGNPLQCLWVYVAKAPTQAMAYGAEQSILRNMAERRHKGEWLTIEATGMEDAAGLARQFSGLTGYEFGLLGSGDGH